MSKKKLAVVIGRFQPVHTAHIELFRAASELADQVLVLIGSANEPRTYKNPFSFGERSLMIVDACHEHGINFASFVPIENCTYSDELWSVYVQNAVAAFSNDDADVVLVGHTKDESSFYLKMFPQWEYKEVGPFSPLDASSVRDLYFRRNWNPNFIANVVPRDTLEWLTTFSSTPQYEQIIREREFVEDYKKQFAGLRYAPTFVTADAVVFCLGHVLLVERKHEPGKGLMALPGGFLNADTDKSMVDAAIRELEEETRIKLPTSVLRGSISDNHVFDAIGRSARGRTITHAFKFSLNGPLPKVKGSDDAAVAKWVPIGEISREEMFEDHYEIIQYFL